jgi:hypothetical protein
MDIKKQAEEDLGKLLSVNELAPDANKTSDICIDDELKTTLDDILIDRYGHPYTIMPTVEINGRPLEYNIGEPPTS